MVKTSKSKIISYMSKRKTQPTALEIAKGAKVNENTTRRALGELINEGAVHKNTRAKSSGLSTYAVSGA